MLTVILGFGGNYILIRYVDTHYKYIKYSISFYQLLHSLLSAVILSVTRPTLCLVLSRCYQPSGWHVCDRIHDPNRICVWRIFQSAFAKGTCHSVYSKGISLCWAYGDMLDIHNKVSSSGQELLLELKTPQPGPKALKPHNNDVM